MKTYDLAVIGSGPGGEKAAVQAAKLKKTVVVIEERPAPGGSCLHTGTIPSKTLRESVRFFALMRQRAIYGITTRMDSNLSVDRLMGRRKEATQSLAERLESTFHRNGVEYHTGRARFTSPHQIEVHSQDDQVETLEAKQVILATGSSPFRPDWIDFTHPRVLDSDTVLQLHQVPRTLTIIGAGVIGCEYATIFSTLGTKVNLVNPRNVLLDFLDLEISNALAYLMREKGIRIRLGEELKKVVSEEGDVQAHFESGKVLKSEYLLFSNGREGNTSNMGLEKIEIPVNQRKQIEVNENFQTCLPHIYAVGDVIGFPSLAATAMDQGRLAALHALTGEIHNHDYKFLPTGIYTIPEISTIGSTEEQLTAEKIPYEVGAATYNEIARGKITGNTVGRMKLLFHRDSLKLLGVHIIGDYATDLVHIGQTVMAFDGSIEYFLDHVFNYPTYSECYRVAALNGLNRL